MENKRSFVRFYFILLTIVGFSLTISMMISSNGIVKIICFTLCIVPALSIFCIKCEQCGALLYRKDQKTHGMPVKGWESAIKDTNCPSCGAYRYSFWEGIKALSQKK